MRVFGGLHRIVIVVAALIALKVAFSVYDEYSMKKQALLRAQTDEIVAYVEGRKFS